MPVMDEFKEERAAMKNGTPRQKIAYFFDYYKWYVVFGVVAIIFTATFLYQTATNKDTAFYAMLINASAYRYQEEKDSINAFAAYTDTDTEKYNIIYDTSVQLGSGADYYAAQQIFVHVGAAEVDVMVSDIASLLQYAYMGDFYDLRDLLDTEQLEKYRKSFYYTDGAVMEEIEAARKDYDHEYIPDYGDPMHPENMQDPVPVGLFLPAECPLLQDYLFSGDSPAVSVLINTKHPEMTSLFIDFLMGRQISEQQPFTAVPSAVQ